METMYRVYCDNKLLHNENIENLKIYNPKATLEQNATSSFEFRIYPSHPYYGEIHKLKSTIVIYQQNEIIFRGRPIELKRAMNNSLDIYCEGELAFLIDSIIAPYDYSGSIEGLFTQFINAHNSQVGEDRQFKVGVITVTDPNDYIVRSNQDFDNTWNAIQEKFIKLLGGYLKVRHEDDGNYLDYLADFTTLNAQHVVFGENMLSVTRTEEGADIATVLIPLGVKDEETGERLTIEDVNDGKNYIENTENIAKYGRITKVQYWDDVTVPTNLLTKGTQALAQMGETIQTIEISAQDMASIDQDITNFRMGSKIRVTSKFHGIDDYYIPTKMTISLFKQGSNKITLNGTIKTLTDSSASNTSSTNQIVTVVENINQDYQVNIPAQIQTLQNELVSLIDQTASSISMEVADRYYSKDDTDTLISEVSTAFTQNKDYFEMMFNSFSQSLEDVLNGTNASFEDIRKYIRFEDGNIILGQIGNEFSVKITNQRISFMQGAMEIAYVSNSKLYNTALQVIESLQIGAFVWIPRANGNLSFTKI